MKNKIVKKIAILSLVIFVTFSFSFQSKFFEIAKQLEIYTNLFKELNMYYVNEINPADFTNKAIKNTLKNLDPYTNFYTEQDVENARIRREGEYGGIGVSVYYTKEGIIISEIYEGNPADKVGLKVGDIIVRVNDLSLKGLDRDTQSSQLKGMPNTSYFLEVKRGSKQFTTEITLSKITINAVPFYKMIDFETGYISLSQFSNKASKEVKKAFKDLKKQGMKKLVFDLRYNPGGSLFESINIVNFFVPKGSVIVKTKGKIKKMSHIYKGNNNPLDLEIPIVVLINGRSASASEIVSGSLQDYDRAVIMGERSFGKGLVQRYFKLSYGTQLKATIAKYYTPSGRCIQELDYANRDLKTGKIPKFSEKEIHRFTTKNGRTVLDGGGVTPDVKIKFSKKTPATKVLLKTRAIFNFTTDYISKHPSIVLDRFRFSEKDFSSFKTYLKNNDTTFITKQEKLFKKAYQSVKKGFISKEYQKINSKLKEYKMKEISKNKDILKRIIETEIIEQLFYKKGLFQYRLKFDTTIKKAVFLLKNDKKYQQILNKKN